MGAMHFTYLSGNHKTLIQAVQWVPDSEHYRGIVQLTHGMVEHIDRYAPFAEFLNDHGFFVVGHDHLGHGSSIRSTEDYGYFTKKHPSETLVEDMHELRAIIQKENPDLPYFMFGHSMGSYLLRQYLAKHRTKLNGAIICGTGYEKPAKVRMGLDVLKALKLVHGDHYRSEKLAAFAFSGAFSKFDLTGADPANSWLSHDEANVRAYYSDPKCNFKFTLNGYQGLLEAVLASCQMKNIKRIPKNLPLLLVSGSDDPVGNLGKGVRKVEALYRESGKDLTCKLYPGFRHEILNEIGKERVYHDILKWIEAHMPNQ